jgi:NHLM bacteriocin system ABC transporter peptidase/ATP-binding protein
MPRVKTPFLLQLEAVECGAACLGIILEHYGRIVPLTELRQECGVSRDGVKAANMLKAAKKYGLQAKGFREGLESALKLKCPYVAFWNFNHFLVVEGHDPRRKVVYLNDPAHGHRTVSMEEFDGSFTGVVLVFEPTPEFRKGGSKPSIAKALAKRFAHARGAVLCLALVGIVLAVPGLLVPAFTRVFVDEILGEGRGDWLRPLVVAMLATVVLKVAVESLKYLLLRRLQIHLAVTMASAYFWQVLRLPLSFYAQRYGGEIATRQKLNDHLAETLAGKLADTALNVLLMVFYAALMFYYDVVLTVIGITLAAINFMALRALGNKRTDANARLRQEYGKVHGASIAALQSMETIKASGQESAFFNTLAGRYAKAINTLQDLQRSTQTLTVLPVLFQGLTTALIYLLGGLRAIEGEMSVGTLVAFTTLMANFQAPIKDLVDLGSKIQEMDGDLKRLDDVLMAKLDPEAAGQHDLVKAPTTQEWSMKPEGEIMIANVTFGYSPLEAPLFDSVTIIVPAGKRVAFVGGSGSGKTTMAYLVCGLYQPWKGAILFDEVPRSQIPHAVLVSRLSMVGQEIFLFEGTVRDNLTLWDRTIPDEVLVRSCEDACILREVLALPGGLDGWLYEGGANLSGGQRQRLEIARALVGNPSILVLDEATSALDAETEALIAERLRLRGCTCILVAHRLSTIRDCDEIVVFDRGRIAERGTHEDLWKSQGLYAQLLRAGEGTEEATV